MVVARTPHPGFVLSNFQIRNILSSEAPCMTEGATTSTKLHFRGSLESMYDLETLTKWKTGLFLVM